MPRKPRRGLRQYLSRRALISLGVAAGILLAGLSLFVALLDRQIVRQFEGRRWDLPAQVYARPLEIYAGLRLSPDDLQRELTALGYSSVASVKSQGTFSRSGGRIVVQTRTFQFWDHTKV